MKTLLINTTHPHCIILSKYNSRAFCLNRWLLAAWHAEWLCLTLAVPDVRAPLSSKKLHFLLSVWVQQESMHTLHIVFHTKVLRVAGPSRNPKKPCYSAPYSQRQPSLGRQWPSSLSPGLTWSYQGGEPLPRRRFISASSDQPWGRGGEGGRREL